MRIALYQGTSLISRLIRWQTRSLYSHAAFLGDDWSVVEAWQPCVRLVHDLSQQHTPGTRVDIFSFRDELTRADANNLWELALHDCGTPYDYSAVLRFITRKPEARRSKAKLFCSEQVFSRCALVGRHLLERTEAWRVPPDWIARSPLLKFDESVVTT